jgi:hypothetical protein
MMVDLVNVPTHDDLRHVQGKKGLPERWGSGTVNSAMRSHMDAVRKRT